MTQTGNGDNTTQSPAIAQADITVSETERRKNDDTRRLANQQMQDAQGGGAFFLFFALLLGLNNDEKMQELTDNGTIEKISNIFNVDVQNIIQSSENIRSGRSSLTDEAERLSSRSSNIDWSEAQNIKISELVKNDAPTMMHPDLISRMESDPKVAQMVKWTMEAAEKHGLDGNLLANQYWFESNFKPESVSECGARGVAQFMPFHKGSWGLETEADFTDPKTSIEAGARYMAHLTERTGDQRLAIVAYNGGEKAIAYAEKNTSGEMNIEKWMEFMAQERAEKGISEETRNLWRHQTFDYVERIDSTFWNQSLLTRAESKQSELSQTFTTAIAATEPLQTDGKQPDPLTNSFDAQGGVDQVAAAQTTTVAEPNTGASNDKLHDLTA